MKVLKFCIPVFALILASCDKDVQEVIDHVEEVEVDTVAVSYMELNQTLEGVSTLEVDLNGDEISDFKFELLDLREFNQGEFPFEDYMAAKVFGLNGAQVLDNSMLGYPDALPEGAEVTGSWSTEGVLGTIADAGQFEGKGPLFLGISMSDNKRGWIQLDCAPMSDKLTLIDAAYTTDSNGIRAGEH